MYEVSTMKPYQRALKTLASGHAYELTFYQSSASKPKARVYMQAALHGAEIQGVAVIRHLQERLARADLPFDFKVLPLANPAAFDTKMGEYGYGRFDPRTGMNWNRGFVNLLSASDFFEAFECESFINTHVQLGYDQAIHVFERALKERLDILVNASAGQPPETQLALILHQEALDADYIFDLHCDSISKPYLYAPQYLLNKRLLNFTAQHFITTPCRFSPCFNQAVFYPFWYFTEQWNAHTGETNVSPKKAFTYELGSKESYCSETAKTTLDGILNYVTNAHNPVSQAWWCTEDDYHRLRAPRGGIFELSCELGKVHLEKEDIGVLHTFPGQEAGIAITYDDAFIPLTVTASPVVHQGDELVKIMTRYQEVS
jgi:predicted deacylase